MFYSQFILAKKGPLGTIWIAAHLERKLRKNQVADTDIGVSVDSILFPEVPIALRLSSHLLLGVVRIYSRKVNYLFHDCSEALLKVKQAFRSTAVDLPPEESTAPYHSITLPETFDLDDFELPDSEHFQGNYVDHHVSTREQITLQDTMDGVVYSTSQFGLDERFGDGDTSQIGLDLDEEMFLDKVATPGRTAVLFDRDEACRHESGQPMTPFTMMDIDDNGNKLDDNRTAEASEVAPFFTKSEQSESYSRDQQSAGSAGPLCGDQIHGLKLSGKGFPSEHHERSPPDLSECTPFTPRLVEEVVLSNGHVEDPTSSCMKETTISSSVEVGVQDVFCTSNEETVQATPEKQQGYPPFAVVATDSISLEVGHSVSSPTSVLVEQSKPVSPTSETVDKNLAVRGNTDRTETSQDGVISNNKPSSSDAEQTQPEGVGVEPPSIPLDTAVASTLVESSDVPLPAIPIVQLESISPESVCLDKTLAASDSMDRVETSQDGVIRNQKAIASDIKQTLVDGVASIPLDMAAASTWVGSCGEPLPATERDSGHAKSTNNCHLTISDAHDLGKIEAKAGSESESTKLQNVVGPDEKSGNGHVLRTCNSRMNETNLVDLGDEQLVTNATDLSARAGQHQSESSGREDPVHVSGTSAVQGEMSDPTSAARNTNLAASNMSECLPCDGAGAGYLDGHLDSVISRDNQAEKLNASENCDFSVPAPEMLLSAPVVVDDAPRNLQVGSTPAQEVSAGPELSGDGLNILSGKKRRFMESTPVLPDGNLSKLSGMPRSKRATDSIPDDNDLLSSILVGRKSSVLKLRATPTPLERAYLKRQRAAPRVSVPKRKVLIDDTLVLHGDTIRQQLTSTEDIRRIRKKAPCTRPEIWTIQKHLLEDEVFNEPLFTGMSADLIGLHNQPYCLTEFRIPETDVNHAHSEVSNRIELPRSTDLIVGTSLEGMPERAVIGSDGEVHEPAERSAQTENRDEEHHNNSIECDTRQQMEAQSDVRPLDLPPDGQMGNGSAMEIDKQGNTKSDVVDQITSGAELALLASSVSGDGCNVSANYAIAPLPISEVIEKGSILAEGVSTAKDESVVREITESASVDAVPQESAQESQVDICGLITAEGVSSAKGEAVIQKLTRSGSVGVVPQNYVQECQVDTCSLVDCGSALGQGDSTARDESVIHKTTESGPVDVVPENMTPEFQVGICGSVNRCGSTLAEGISTVNDESVIRKISESGSVNVVPQNSRQEHQFDMCASSFAPILAPVDNCLLANSDDAQLDASTSWENITPSFTNMSGGSGGHSNLTAVIDDSPKEGCKSDLGLVADDEIMGEVRDNEANSSTHLMHDEQGQRDSLCPLDVNQDAGNIHVDGNNVGSQDKIPDAKTATLDNTNLDAPDEFGNTLDGNQTVFLNFDDDEVTEEGDTSMPNAEEAQFLDNSGWSSRTRAVARYLQTLFENESGHERNVVPVDNLLSGKTRKEASRMFFETLVLKTRDYIQVKQDGPFSDISIEPTAKLMKSDF